MCERQEWRDETLDTINTLAWMVIMDGEEDT